ncbi:polymorphic toxin-type HINT domain-containing protein [Streptomyces sp. NPDC102441]|uniref:polymorphic toxin-type HINT domain-containing protein n=1 Tax=Streptomyces sp. NPDC102441 TaxID=3366176 RepID=UPI003819A081
MGVVLAGALTAGILSAFPALADEGAAAAGAPVALGSVTATGDDQLFALAADHSAVYRWNGEGTDWTKIGGPAETLHAGGAGLFATARSTGKVFKYEGTPQAWSQVGEAGADFAVTGDRLYALNPDRTAVYEWAGQGTDWTRVGGPAEELDAGGAGLFATGRDDKVFKYEGTPETWTQIGEPGADFAVTGDRLYGIAADHTAVFEWSGHGTDWSRVGGPAQSLYAGGAGLFATDRTSGQLSKYNGEPDSWTKAGEPGAGFAVSDTHLYGLAPNGTAVLRWDGTGTAAWTPIGTPTTAPAPPPGQETPPPAPPQPQETTSAPQEATPAPAPEETAEATENPTAPAEAEAPAPAPNEEGHRGITPAPLQAAGPSDTQDEHAVRMAVTAQDDLYTLTADKSGLWKRGSDGWSPLSGAANAVHAGRAGVFMTEDDGEQIRKYNAATSAWDPVGGSAGQFAVTGKHLYRLTPHGIGEWHGDTWTPIGGPARNIYAGRAGLFATNPDTGDIHKYEGKPGKWTRIGGPGAHFAVGKDHVYGIAPDHTAVYEWTGKGTDWTRIGGPAKHLYAGGAGLFATNPTTGNIHQYDNTPDAWTEIGGPGATFTVSDTQLYGLSPDLTTTYRWNGTGSDWTRLGGAADIAQQQKDEQLLAETCGQECVEKYREAKKLLETSITDWLKANGGQALIDTFGITAVLECVNDHDLSSCLEVVVDAGSTLLTVGAFKKAYRLTESAKNVAEKLPEFKKKLTTAQEAYKTLRTIIDTARKALEQLPDDDSAADESCETSNSFLPNTPVLMADGSRTPIEDIRLGDTVLATDPGTGDTRPEPVTDVITGHGEKHLVKVTVDTDGNAGDRTADITATEHHPFWTVDPALWTNATDLTPGNWLRTSAGVRVQVERVSKWTAPQKVHNLTVARLHTYYVIAGETPLLVHNAKRDKCSLEIDHVGQVDQDWVTKGAHVNMKDGMEVALRPDGKGSIKGEAVRLRKGTATQKQVDAVVAAIKLDAKLRGDMLRVTRSAMEVFESSATAMREGRKPQWRFSNDRSAELQALIAAMEKM